MKKTDNGDGDPPVAKKKTVTWSPNRKNAVKRKVHYVDVDMELESNSDHSRTWDDVEEKDDDDDDDEDGENKCTFWRVEDLYVETAMMPVDMKEAFESVKNGQDQALELLLNEDTENTLITSHDSKGRTLLHYASGFGHEKIVDILLQKGAQVNVCDDEYLSTPLTVAAAYGSLSCLQLLLSKGVDVNINVTVPGNKSALHWAVISGNLECVKALIRAGALQCFSQGRYAVTPFLMSIEQGNAEIMEFLLDNGANLHDVEGQTHNSALHLAAKSGSRECMEVLFRFQSAISLEIRNHNGETPLHLVSDEKCTLFLLSKKANPNSTDVLGNTPLHRHVERGHQGFPIVQALLTCPETKVNAKDNESNTPLHKAVVGGFSRSACILLAHGANVTILNNEKQNPFSHIKLKMPHIIPNIKDSLDTFISIKQNEPFDVDCTLSLDFSAIGMDSDSIRLKYRNSSLLHEGKKLSSTGRMTDLVSPNILSIETKFLNSLANDDHKDILSHPLIDVFLELKWNKTRVIFFISFLCHFMLTAVYTVYTMEAFMKSCPWNETIKERGFKHADENTGPTYPWDWFSLSIKVRSTPPQRNPEDPNQPDVGATVRIFWCFLLLGTLIFMTKEIIKFIQGPKIYLTLFENLGQWVFTVTIFVGLYWEGTIPLRCEQLFPEQYPTAAVGLLISWSMILVRTGRFPYLGLYVQMFGKVLKNFGGFIFVYLSLLSAFSLAFCVLFPGEPSFSSFPLAMLKVFTMMTGEVDYEDLFYGSRGDRLKPTTTSEVPPAHSLPHPVMSHLIYAAFVLIVTTVLMNLLVGLAVNDIQDLEKEAAVDRLSRQTRCIFQLENFVFSKTLSSCLPSWVMNCLKRQILLQPMLKMAQFNVKPNNPRDELISETLKAKVMTIALKQRERKLNLEFPEKLYLGCNRGLNRSNSADNNHYCSNERIINHHKDIINQSMNPQHLKKINDMDEKLNIIQSQIDRLSDILLNGGTKEK